MGQFGRRRPSAALGVAIIALVVAASGSAFAAGRLVSGDSLIRKHSLSGNRLRGATTTGQEIKLSSLGQVPNAKNAAELGGHPASAFMLASSGSSGVTRSGLVTANGGQTVKVASFGPFTVNLVCTSDGTGTFDASLTVDSSTANSEAFGSPMTPGTPQPLADTVPDSQFEDTASVTDFVAPPDAFMVYLIDSIFMPGTTAPCAASVLAAKG
jgi:hypothetical protein